MVSYHPDTCDQCDHWDPMPLDHQLQLVDVAKNSKEYLGISNPLSSTISQVEIQWIHRVQNVPMYKQYLDKKYRMHERNRGIVNEKTLFHGSPKFEDICRSEDGFDIRLANQGFWGKGNYFADSAQYSHTYAFFDSATSCHVVILAYVLTGLSCPKNSDSSLTMPPLLPSANNGLNERYDTVNGSSESTTIYITYSNDLAYPAYLICYKKIVDGAVQGHGVFDNPLLRTTMVTSSGRFSEAMVSPVSSSRPKPPTRTRCAQSAIASAMPPAPADTIPLLSDSDATSTVPPHQTTVVKHLDVAAYA